MDDQMVIIKQYDPNWKSVYETEKKLLLDSVGEKILAVEHIGSTSVPGLIARPTIDIMIGVYDLFAVGPLLKPLKALNYDFVPKPQFRERRFFRKGESGEETFQLHICEYKSDEWKDLLLFRDFLKNHPKTAKEYAQFKFTISRRYKYDWNTYVSMKGPFVKKILENARLEFEQKSLS